MNKHRQYEYDQTTEIKLNASRNLYSMGVKKNGYSNSLPIDPITLQYHNNPYGSQIAYNDEERLLKSKVRAHHLQTSSTCGYNLINGQGLVKIEKYIP